MRDPFPLPRSQLLSDIIQPLASYLSLQTLPHHIHEVLFAVTLYQIINAYVSPHLSRRLFPKTYPNLNHRTRISWDVHVVSLVQSCIVNALALWVVWKDDERNEMNWKGRVWGYTGAQGLVVAFAAGYFLWDLIICLSNIRIFGLGLLVHAISALGVFSFGFRPFVNYYAPIYILYELSSPFLNVHWFCDKLDLTGSPLQFYNGLVLITTFFFARIVMGSYQTFFVYRDIWNALYSPDSPARIVSGLGESKDAAATEDRHGPGSDIMRFARGHYEVPLWLATVYVISNIILMILNVYWFGKMIETLRKRFDPPLGTKGIGEKKDDEKKEQRGPGREERVSDVQLGRGLYENGRKTVEIDTVEIKNRRRRG